MMSLYAGAIFGIVFLFFRYMLFRLLAGTWFSSGTGRYFPKNSILFLIRLTCLSFFSGLLNNCRYGMEIAVKQVNY